MLKAQIEAVEALAPGADHVMAERAAKMIAALAKTAETLSELKVQEDRVNSDDDPGRLPSDDDAIERLRADLERRLARLSASLEQKRDAGQAEPERPEADGSPLGLLCPS
jgi:hypothetical protein